MDQKPFDQLRHENAELKLENKRLERKADQSEKNFREYLSKFNQRGEEIENLTVQLNDIKSELGFYGQHPVNNENIDIIDLDDDDEQPKFMIVEQNEHAVPLILRNFKCNLRDCNFVTLSKAAFNRHITLHSKADLFCGEENCTYSNKSRKRLDNHIMRKHAQQVFMDINANEKSDKKYLHRNRKTTSGLLRLNFVPKN